MPPSHAKMHLKKAPQKLNFVMAKAMSKSYNETIAANALASSRIIMHSNTASFSIKITLRETKNILFSKNY